MRWGDWICPVFFIVRGTSTSGVSRSYFTRLVRLSYLAPDITQVILEGRQPRDLTAEKLLEHSRLPLAWHQQRTVLGFT
jgi:site-specific DNA recombinase